ncbi:MAG: RNB domain-containing ribonuclease [Halioglobus sp.]
MLRSNRETHGLVMEERQEYRWILNDAKQVESIERYEKLVSQKLVEECMVAANRCAANFLVQHNATGPFVAHPGFRSNRAEELRSWSCTHRSWRARTLSRWKATAPSCAVSRAPNRIHRCARS